MVRIYGTVIAGLLGLAFGSFLNVCLSRWPRGMSVVKPRSYCENCGRTLSWWENVPLLSWIALRGRCRTCRVWIGWRTLLVEFAVGGLWAFLAWDALRKIWLGPTVVYAFENQADLTGRIGFAILAWVLTALAVLDAEHLWLPDWLTLPGIAVGLVWSVLLKQLSYRDAIDYFPKPPIHSDVFKALLDVALSAGLILLIRWVYWLIRRREGIGLGDAKLMAMLGAWLGFSGAILSFGIGVMLGAIAALAMLAIRQKNHAAENWAITKLPLGTFLCIGGIISGLWGSRIIDAYLHWAGF